MHGVEQFRKDNSVVQFSTGIHISTFLFGNVKDKGLKSTLKTSKSKLWIELSATLPFNPGSIALMRAIRNHHYQLHASLS